MRFYLLTVERCFSSFGTHVQVQPPVPIRNLAPNMIVPMAGDDLELCLPDGRVIHAPIGHFGIEVWRGEDGHFYTASNPSDPVLTLTIAGGLRPEDVPPGTEIWLREAKYQIPTEAS